MSARLFSSLRVSSGCFAFAVSLFLIPMTLSAQTFFGSGGSTNSATNVTNVALGFGTLNSNPTGLINTAIGNGALFSDTSGAANTATGSYALYLNTTGSNNTASGIYALANNTTGFLNTATGSNALFTNSTGSYNTAVGNDALYSNGAGNNNTATGYQALYTTTTNGNGNTANGYLALYYNTASSNVAIGSQALFFNTTGTYNTANGYQALYNNTTASGNTASGYAALYNSTGSNNTASGYVALFSNTTGNSNTAYGLSALISNTSGSNNVASGDGALFSNTTGNANTALGHNAGRNLTTGSNNIMIGHVGASSDTGIIRIGTSGTQTATFIAGINGVTASGGVQVFINSSGKLGTLTSSERFKYDIHNLGNVSNNLMDLRPVSFRYKEAAEDGSHPIQYGLIAEEVAKIYPDMVQYDKEGKPFTVYYQQLTPMMLNELQKAHQDINALQSEMAVRRQGQGNPEVKELKAELASLQQTQQMQLLVFAALILIGLVLVAVRLGVRTPRAY